MKRRSTDSIALLLGFFLTCGLRSQGLADPAERTYYVPDIEVLTPAGAWWISQVSIFNQRDQPGYYSCPDAYGYIQAYPSRRWAVPGGFRGAIGMGYCYGFGPAAPLERRYLGVLALTVSDGVVVSASLDKVDAQSQPCPPTQAYFSVSGRTLLPVFTSLYPSGATSTCGPVFFGNEPYSCQGAAGIAGFGRVSVTLLNAGGGEASFVVRVFHMTSEPQLPGVGGTAPRLEFRFTVASREVAQFPLDVTFHDAQGTDHHGLQGWITVSADQPYLAYASVSAQYAASGTNSFEVYPAQLAE